MDRRVMLIVAMVLFFSNALALSRDLLVYESNGDISKVYVVDSLGGRYDTVYPANLAKHGPTVMWYPVADSNSPLSEYIQTLFTNPHSMKIISVSADGTTTTLATRTLDSHAWMLSGGVIGNDMVFQDGLKAYMYSVASGFVGGPKITDRYYHLDYYSTYVSNAFDMDHDGNLEIATLEVYNYRYLKIYDINARAIEAIWDIPGLGYYAGGPWTTSCWGDVGGDGNLDIYYRSGDYVVHRVVYYDGSYHLTAEENTGIYAPFSYWSCTIRDVDGDGVDELVAPYSEGIGIFDGESLVESYPFELNGVTQASVASPPDVVYKELHRYPLAKDILICNSSQCFVIDQDTGSIYESSVYHRCYRTVGITYCAGWYGASIRLLQSDDTPYVDIIMYDPDSYRRTALYSVTSNTSASRTAIFDAPGGGSMDTIVMAGWISDSELIVRIKDSSGSNYYATFEKNLPFGPWVMTGSWVDGSDIGLSAWYAIDLDGDGKLESIPARQNVIYTEGGTVEYTLPVTAECGWMVDTNKLAIAWKNSEGMYSIGVYDLSTGHFDSNFQTPVVVQQSNNYSGLYKHCSIGNVDDDPALEAILPDGTSRIYIYDTEDGNFEAVFAAPATITFAVTLPYGEFYTNNAPPSVGDLTYSPDPAYVASPVTFSIEASDPDGDELACTWNFGDGTIRSNDCSDISYEYSEPGTYTVSVIVSDGEWSKKREIDVTILNPNHPPTADFTWSPTEPYDVNTITFYGEVSDPDEGDTVTCTWDFGDGETSGVSCQQVTHKYDAAGSYSVVLTACDNHDACTTVEKTINVEHYNYPPSVSFTYSPTNPTDEDIVTFSPTVSDPDGSIESCTWDLGDGTTIESCGSITHQYSAGSYTVTLTACDNEGKCSSYSRSITVYHQNHPPSVSFTYSPTSPVTNEPVVFTPSVSDPDGDEVSCTWIIGSVQIQGCQEINYTFTQPGTYTVTLTATDGQDSASATHSITVASGNHPPMITLTVSDNNVDNITPVVFNLTVSEPDGDPYTCSWDFGDGETSTQCGQVIHQYDEPGTYTAHVTVCDDENACTSASKTIFVYRKNILPTGEIWVEPDTPFVGSDATIYCSYTDSDGNVVSVLLTTGDGGEYNECNVSHTFTQAGDIIIRLTLTDNDGGTSTIEKKITVLPGSSGGITGMAILNDPNAALNFVIGTTNSFLAVVIAIVTNSLALWLFISWMVAKKSLDRRGDTARAMYVFIGILWLGYILGFVKFWSAALITLAILVILDSRGVRVPVVSEVREKIQATIHGETKVTRPMPASEAGIALPPPKPRFDFSNWLGGNGGE